MHDESNNPRPSPIVLEPMRRLREGLIDEILGRTLPKAADDDRTRMSKLVTAALALSLPEPAAEAEEAEQLDALRLPTDLKRGGPWRQPLQSLTAYAQRHETWGRPALDRLAERLGIDAGGVPIDQPDHPEGAGHGWKKQGWRAYVLEVLE